MQKKLNISKVELFKLINLEKLKQVEIAMKFGVSRSAVQRAQKRYNIVSLENYRRKCPEHISGFQQEVLNGTILGDDCVYRYPSTIHASLLCYHSISNRDYIQLKFNIWKDFIGYDELKEIKRNKGRRLMFQTVCHPDFEDLRKNIYRDKVKIITKNHLKQMTDVSLAFWFMDDGSRCKNGGLAIHTNCFTYDEVEMCCEFLRSMFGYYCHPQKRAANQWVVFFSNKTSSDFAERIVPYVHPSMRYKLQGIYNYVKNPQRLHAIPFRLQEFDREDIV